MERFRASALLRRLQQMMAPLPLARPWTPMPVLSALLRRQASAPEQLQAQLAVSCGVPAAAQTLLHKLRPLPEWQSLGACGVEDKAVIHLKSSAAHPRKLKLLLK